MTIIFRYFKYITIDNISAFKFKTPISKLVQNPPKFPPTHSQMKGEINVLTLANFKINFQYLQEDFDEPENEVKRI